MEKKKRTKLKDRTLPDYTRGEEIFNMVSHIVGGALAIAALVLCVIFSALKGDPWAVVASAVYGGTMVALYAMSSIYHGLTAERAKKVFQVIDHCTIYFLIAGTYTAITLAGIRVNHPVIAFVIFGIVWACCLGAATFTAIDLEKYKKMAMICYLGMGWCIILFIKPTMELLGFGIPRQRWNRVYDRSRIVWRRKDEALYAFDLSFICYRRKCTALLYDIILCNHEIKIGGLKW